MLIARLLPGNHVEENVKGVLHPNLRIPLLVVGNTNHQFGKFSKQNYKSDQIRFVGGIFDEALLNQLRYYSKIYFHGHSASGTNPSLLEAMAASASICTHNDPFTRSVLGTDARYFDTDSYVAGLNNSSFGKPAESVQVYNNIKEGSKTSFFRF